jgi:hypothetical protein
VKKRRKAVSEIAFLKVEVDAFVLEYTLPPDKMSLAQAAEELCVSIRTMHNWCGHRVKGKEGKKKPQTLMCPLIGRKLWSTPARYIGAGGAGGLGNGYQVKRSEIEWVRELLEGVKRGKDGRPMLGGRGTKVKAQRAPANARDAKNVTNSAPDDLGSTTSHTMSALPTSFPDLGIEVDWKKKRIIKGGRSPLEFGRSEVWWHFLTVALCSHPNAYSVADLKKEYPSDWEARKQAKADLNGKLRGIGLQIDQERKLITIGNNSE